MTDHLHANGSTAMFERIYSKTYCERLYSYSDTTYCQVANAQGMCL